MQELERFGTLLLVSEQGGLISTTPVSTCKTARDDSALLRDHPSAAIPMATATAPTCLPLTGKVCYQVARAGCCDSMRSTVPSEAPSLDIPAKLRVCPRFYT